MMNVSSLDCDRRSGCEVCSLPDAKNIGPTACVAKRFPQLEWRGGSHSFGFGKRSFHSLRGGDVPKAPSRDEAT